MKVDIIALLRLFQSKLPDTETHKWVFDLAQDESRWSDAHRLFRLVRARTLQAIENKSKLHIAQYGFEEICLKSIYNESGASELHATEACPAPFDHDSPYYIIISAIRLARCVGIGEKAVIDIVCPESRESLL